MNEEKTFEVFEEIGALLRSVCSEDPEGWQFNKIAMNQIVENSRQTPGIRRGYDCIDVEQILLALSKISKQ